MIDHLFVYGTLRPGDVRWPLLEPFVVDDGADDSAVGQLFDTGLDYPAATFGGDGVTTVILGRTCRLVNEGRTAALGALDHEEGTVEGLYRRIAISTRAGIDAWAYAYGDGLQLTPIDSGDWFRR